MTSHTANADLTRSKVGLETQSETRQRTLELFRCGPELLAETLRHCPKKMWLYRPVGNRWSIHEIILHLADSEAEGYVRCRQFIAEPGSEVSSHDSARLAERVGYIYQSATGALGLIVRLRKMTHRVLLYVPDDMWQHTVKHRRHGMVTLETWLNAQVHHITHHILQIHQIYAEWPKYTCRTRRGRRNVSALSLKLGERSFNENGQGSMPARSIRQTQNGDDQIAQDLACAAIVDSSRT
jgi:hypothetical protein